MRDWHKKSDIEGWDPMGSRPKKTEQGNIAQAISHFQPWCTQKHKTRSISKVVKTWQLEEHALETFNIHTTLWNNVQNLNCQGCLYCCFWKPNMLAETKSKSKELLYGWNQRNFSLIQNRNKSKAETNAKPKSNLLLLLQSSFKCWLLTLLFAFGSAHCCLCHSQKSALHWLWSLIQLFTSHSKIYSA